MIALALAGCFAVTEEPVCRLVPEPVADDVEVGGVTAAEVVAAVEGAGAWDGAWSDDTPVGVALEVARAGDAEHVRAAIVMERTRGWGVGTSHVDLDVDPEQCVDYLRVPVTAALSTDDGALELAQGGYARPEDDGFEVTADLPIDALPHDGEPDDYDEVLAHLSAWFPIDGEVSGRVGWVGTRTFDGGASMSGSGTVLSW